MLSTDLRLGKTTLAHILATEMGVNIKVTSVQAIERAGDLAAILTNLRAGDILFIDEVHRLGRMVEKFLPSHGGLLLISSSARSCGTFGTAEAAALYRCGRTTRLALLSAPLRARFGAVYRLDYYDTKALSDIVRRGARLLNVPCEEDGILEIARRARGTPRIALRMLRRVRDYAEVKAGGSITAEVAEAGLSMMNIDRIG